MKKVYSIHEYAFIKSEKQLVYRYHESNEAKNTIKELVESNRNCTKVFLVLNGVENEEEAYVFEERAMIRVHSYDAIKAVELISCLPFFQYSRDLLIDLLTESMYLNFHSR